MINEIKNILKNIEEENSKKLIQDKKNEKNLKKEKVESVDNRALIWDPVSETWRPYRVYKPKKQQILIKSEKMLKLLSLAEEKELEQFVNFIIPVNKQNKNLAVNNYVEEIKNPEWFKKRLKEVLLFSENRHYMFIKDKELIFYSEIQGDNELETYHYIKGIFFKIKKGYFIPFKFFSYTYYLEKVKKGEKNGDN